MDCVEIKVEMAEGGPLEALVITEEGEVSRGEAESASQSSNGAPAQKKEEEHTDEDDVMAKTCLEKLGLEEQRANEEVIGNIEDDTENMSDGQNRGEGEMLGMTGTQEQAAEEVGGTEDEKVGPPADMRRLNSSEEQPGGTDGQDQDPKKAHRLTPDFPEALYELLCTLQEGRRLNDQRCSFRLESGVRRRRCHSEPNTTKPANRVVFSSMTSLQQEEFFELVATAQARRLDDQRAQLERSSPTKPKARSFRGSLKQLSFAKRPALVPSPALVPAPVPKEDLYNMILTTQAQGRLEDQRSRAPGPMDDEDFFSLLLRVQGGRMDEQRTELPCMLQT